MNTHSAKGAARPDSSAAFPQTESNSPPPAAALIQAWRWFCTYPTLTGVLVTVFGGLVILAYLVPLGFVPDFDLASALGVLVLAAMLGGLSIAAFAITLLAPAMLARQLAGNRDAPLWRSNAQYVAMALSAFLFWVALFYLNIIGDQTWIVWLLAAVLGGTLLLAGLNQRTVQPPWFKTAWFGFLLLLSMQGLSFFTALSLFVPGAIKGLANIVEWQQWLLLIVWCMLVGLSNTMLLRAKSITFGLGFIFAVAIVFALITLTRNPYYLYVMPIHLLKLGNIENVTLTVPKSAAAVLQAACRVAEAPRACTKQPEELAADYASYENITILSRLGNQYYLQLCQHGERTGPCATDMGLRVAIDKKDTGWSIRGKVESR